LVLGYLGFGCLHCVEQLKAFAPLAADFDRAGIRLLGVGTDPPASLSASLAKYSQESGSAFPFTLLADDSLATFRAWGAYDDFEQPWGAYDDFEQRPLHITLLIDAAGRVRWQAIGHEPFSDAKFLLAEARRLLEGDFARPWPEPR
jgi:peroxiredoxin